MFNLGIFGKPSTKESEDLLTMSPNERSADYEEAVRTNNHKRLQEHEELIQSVMKGLGF